MDPLTILGIQNGVQAVGNFASNLIGNKQNKKLVRETNAQNYKMFQEQNQFNRDMAFDMMQYENAYNDPSAVRQRLEDAGYNPFAMDQNGAQFANADGSTPTAGTPIPMQAPQLQAPTFDFASSLGDLTLKAAQAKKLGADTRTVDELRDKLVKQYDLDNQTKEFDLQLKRAYDEIDRAWQNEEQRVRVREYYQKIHNMEQDFKNAVLDGDIKKIEKERSNILKEMDSVRSKWLPKELEQSLKNLVKQGQQIDAQTGLFKASAENQRAQASYTTAQEKTVNALRDPLVQAQKTGNIDKAVDILCKLVKTPEEIKEIQARTRNLSADERKKFAETVSEWINSGQSLLSSDGYLDLPLIGKIGSGVHLGK